MATARKSVKKYDVSDESITELHDQICADFHCPPLSKRSKFRLVSEYVKWLQNGTKCTTVRYRPGAIDVPTAAELPLLESSSDDDNGVQNEGETHPIGTVKITNMMIKPFGMLDNQDARRDGFSTEQELKEALQWLYSPIYARRIADDEYVSVYRIRLIETACPQFAAYC